MERRAESFRLYGHHELAWMGSCKETNGSVCRESELKSPTIFSDDNDLCSFLSEMSGLDGGQD